MVNSIQGYQILVTIMNIKDMVAKSLSAGSSEIMPYIPYLLQDLWELGGYSRDIIDLIKQYIPLREIKILDLACGKGALAVKIAEKLCVQVKGIDYMPEFIQVAQEKAKKYKVQDMCEFEIGDIRKSVRNEKNYDVVVLSAVGDVLGNVDETLKILSKIIVDGGYIIIDDTISADGEICPTKKQWLKSFDKAKLTLIDTKLLDESVLIKINSINQDYIETRAFELEQQYPKKAKLFREYVRKQREESNLLESELICVTWLLKKKVENN